MELILTEMNRETRCDQLYGPLTHIDTVIENVSRSIYHEERILILSFYNHVSSKEHHDRLFRTTADYVLD